MILPDHEILDAIKRGHIVIHPFNPERIQPASIEVHLGREIRTFNKDLVPYIDTQAPNPNLTSPALLPHKSRPYILPTGQFILASTVERLEMPRDIVGRVEGKSSMGRNGLTIHATAGFIDPGFRGPITLEISNIGIIPVALYQGMPIGQIAFMRMSSPVKRPYGHPELGSHYQDQEGPTPAAALTSP